MTLEAQATRDGIIFLDRIDRDHASGRLVFHFLGSSRTGRVLTPAIGPVVRVLEFTGVENFREVWDSEEDTQLIEQIIGITERTVLGGSDYIVRLDQSEMYFWSCAQPSIRDFAGAVA